MAVDIGQTRWLLFQQAGSSISTAFLVVVVSWLSVIFASYGLFAPANATAIVTTPNTAMMMTGTSSILHPSAA